MAGLQTWLGQLSGYKQICLKILQRRSLIIHFFIYTILFKLFHKDNNNYWSYQFQGEKNTQNDRLTPDISL